MEQKKLSMVNNEHPFGKGVTELISNDARLQFPTPKEFYAGMEQLSCIHIYKKTQPSQLDQNNTLVWQCVKCGHKKPSM